MGIRRNKTILEQAADYVDTIVEAASEKAGPAIAEALDKAGPVWADAKDKAGPVWADAKDKAGPALADAKDRATPLLAAGVAAAAAQASNVADFANEKAADLKGEPEEEAPPPQAPDHHRGRRPAGVHRQEADVWRRPGQLAVVVHPAASADREGLGHARSTTRPRRPPTSRRRTTRVAPPPTRRWPTPPSRRTRSPRPTSPPTWSTSRRARRRPSPDPPPGQRSGHHSTTPGPAAGEILRPVLRYPGVDGLPPGEQPLDLRVSLGGDLLAGHLPPPHHDHLVHG